MDVPKIDTVTPDRSDGRPESPRSEAAEPSLGGQLPEPGLFAAIAWIGALFLIQYPLLLFAVAQGFDKGLFPVALTTLTGCLAASLIVGLKYGRDSYRALALRVPELSHVACLLLLALPLLIVLLAIGSWLEMAYQSVGIGKPGLEAPVAYAEFYEGAAGFPLPLTVVLILFFGGVLPAVYEELFLRGFVGRGLVARWGVVGGVALTSVLFGLMHAHPIQSVVTAIMGIVLHTVYLLSRSLLAPVVLHAATNSLAFVIGLVVQRLPWPLILAALVSVAAVSWIYYNVRVRWVLPNLSVWTPGYVTAEMPPPESGAQLQRQRVGKRPLIVAVVAYVMFIAVFLREALQ
jgi:membrane protease YdiL (CAAX protease family)